MAPQVHGQFNRRCCGRQFDLDEPGRTLGPALAPVAEGGVVQTLLTGEGRGGQSAAIKSGQKLGTPSGIGGPARATWGAIR